MVIEKDEWKIETYGDDLYFMRITNTDTGDMYVDNKATSIHKSKYLLCTEFDIVCENCSYIHYSQNARQIRMGRIKSYEDSADRELCDVKKQYNASLQHYENVEKLLLVLNEGMEQFTVGPTKIRIHDGWKFKWYGDKVFTLKKGEEKYIVAGVVINRMDDIRIETDVWPQRLRIGRNVVYLDRCSSELDYMTKLYTQKSSDLDNRGLVDSYYEKRIKKLESILESLNGAILM